MNKARIDPGGVICVIVCRSKSTKDIARKLNGNQSINEQDNVIA